MLSIRRRVVRVAPCEAARMDDQHPAEAGPGVGEALAETLAQHGAARYADVDALLPYLDLPATRREEEPRDGG